MDENKQIDEFDKMFYDYFDNDKEVPQRIHDTIYSAFDRRRQKRKRINILKRVAMIIVSFGVMTTGIVFADDIINFITSLFTNSTDGIDAAVQNGYVQTVDMEYVYDNDIGVKVDNLILDDTNLDISFVYNYQGAKTIDSLELYEYTIKDENDNILYEFSEEQNINDYQTFINEVIKDNEIIQINENTYKESIIYSGKKISKFNKIIIEIQSINLISENNTNLLNVNWKLEININDVLTTRNNEYYNILDNKYIDSGVITLTETSLKIKLDFKTKLDEQIFSDRENIILMDSNGKIYYYKFSDMKYTDNGNELYLEYDIGKHFSNIEELKLIIKYNEEITITFFK